MRLAALAWRSLAARPLRTALTVIGVALGVAIVGATLVANQASAEALTRAARELLGNAELRVRAFDEAGFTPRAVNEMRRIPGVLNAAAVSERPVSTMSREPDQVYTLLLLGVDPDDEARIRDHDLVAGTFLAAGRPAGILVNARWAEQHGLGVGDGILLNGRRQGVPRNRIVGLLDDTGFGALAGGSVAVFNRDFLESAFDAPVPVRYVDLQLATGRVADVQAELDATLGEPFVVETAADAELELGRAQAGFAGLAFLFAMVALAVGAFLVANTLAMTVSERIRELGLLRAAGATGRQLMGIVLRQGAAIGVIGGLVGVLLGVLAATALIGFLRSTRAVLIEGVPLNPGGLALALVMGWAVTLAAASLPAMAASRISPLDALRPSRRPGGSLAGRLRWLVGFVAAAVLIGGLAYPLERGDASPIASLVAVAVLLAGAVGVAVALQPLAVVIGRPFELFFGAQGRLGRANLGRDRARTGLTVGALSIGLAAVVALGAVSASARSTADTWIGSILPGGHAIRLGAAFDVETWRPTFEEIAGAGKVSPIVDVPAVSVEDDQPREVSLAGIEPTVFQDSGSLIFVAGRRAAAFQALRDGGAVLVPDAVARRDGLTVGARLPLAVPGGEVQTFEVAGVIAYTLPARSPDGALLISLADARDRFGVSAARLWALGPRSDTPLAAFRAAADETARTYAGELVTAEQLADELSQGLGRLIGLFDVLALLAVVIAGLGIVNTLAVGVVERAREIAILRSHGMTVGQVQAMVVAEASIMGAVGGVAAVLAGLLVAWVTVTIGAPGDFAAGLAVPWALAGAVILLGVGVASAAGIYPARLAARTPITANLKHFE